MSRSRLLPALLLAASAAAAFPSRADAQDPSTPSIRVPARLPAVRGVVVDAASGRPVAGASVHIDRAHLRAGTDSTGAFAMRRAPAGTQLLRVRAAGYKPVMQLVRVVPGGGAEVRIPLTPDPILLEGIRVVADRLETRRRAVPLSSRVIRGNELALSPAPDMQAFLRQHVGIAETPCHSLAGFQGLGNNGSSAGGVCLRVRGVATQVGVYVDDAPLIGGWDILSTYDPSEFARVEVYRGGAIMHLYTVAFLERAARRDYAPQPLLF